MTDSSIGRYLNLVRYIRNWPEYFRQKRAESFSNVRFVTRGKPLIFDALNNFLMSAGYRTSFQIAGNGRYALYARR